MKGHRVIALLAGALLLLCVGSAAQTKIMIPAGTPEDKALQEITSEADAEKRRAMLEEFVQKFASNPQAVAYGNWQLAQYSLSTGNTAKALEYGDKALAAMPDVLEILMSQVDAAQQAKNAEKTVDYAVRGAVVINSLSKQPKPEGVNDADWSSQLAQQRQAVQPQFDYFEVAAYNAITGEQDPKKRVALIERFTSGFPESKFGEAVTALAIMALGQLKDTARLAEFSEKAVAGEKPNAKILILLANAFADDPKGTHLAKAGTYARKAVELSKSDADSSARATEGVAHSVLGYVLLRQDKFPAAVAELKTATTMLKDSPQDLAAALFRLGWAYARMERPAEATQALTQAGNIDSPYRQPARDMLAKIQAARSRAR